MINVHLILSLDFSRFKSSKEDCLSIMSWFPFLIVTFHLIVVH